MLPIMVPAMEMFDEINNVFFKTQETVLHLEHSLLSLKKWESKWKIPFLSTDSKTIEQSLDYIRCMTLNQNVNPIIYNAITLENIKEVQEYINDPMTATTITSNKKSPKKQIVTAEIIYYWMVSFGIPFEAQKWHLNQLLMLIQVCEIRNSPKKKMSKSEIMAQNRALNEARTKRRGMSG